jgi:hypothetical protein
MATSVPEEKAMMTSKASSPSSRVVDGASFKAAFLDLGGSRLDTGGDGIPAGAAPVVLPGL